MKTLDAHIGRGKLELCCVQPVEVPRHTHRFALKRVKELQTSIAKVENRKLQSKTLKSKIKELPITIVSKRAQL